MKRLEKILLVFILILLILPAIQKKTGLFHVPDLAGDFVLVEKPEFNSKAWLSGDFQTSFNAYLEDHIGFRNLLVRISNQLDYSLFDELHADGVVQGKGHQLFEYDYIRAYTGGDFLGEDNIDQRIRKLKFVQQYLKDSLNINFTLVFEPGKASFYPEYIPDKYFDNALPQTNYKYFKEKAIAYAVNFIDFNQWLKELKANAAYPLYAPNGTHWTTYGASIAADSLQKYIAKTGNIKWPGVRFDSLVLENRTHKEDHDIGSALNLLFPLPEKGPFAYPVPPFDTNPDDSSKPMVLVIADSYYWNIFNTTLPYKLFKKPAFWYFGKKVYPETYSKPVFADDLNVKEEVEKQDFLFLMVTERFLHKFDWALVDNLYKLYGLSSKYEKVYDYKANICIYSQWFNDIIAKAKHNHISISEMLDREARYLFLKTEPDTYMVMHGYAYYTRLIRSDAKWLALVQYKADKEHVSLDERPDTVEKYMFGKENPEAYKAWQQIELNKEQIRNDSLHLERVKQKAAYYYLSLEEMLQIEAERMME